MSSTDEIEARLRQLREEQTTLWERDSELFYQSIKASYDGYIALKPERAAVRERLDEIRGLMSELYDELFAEVRRQEKLKENQFHRPGGWLGKGVARKLGPLPEMAPRIQPTAENLAKVKSYRLMALGLMAAAITSLLLLVNLAPWSQISPASLIFAVYTYAFGAGWGQLLAIITTIFLMLSPTILDKNRYDGKFWDKAAMLEEQWFRMGAENWSLKQRFSSTCLFGLVHVANIIYPIASLLVVTLVGSVFMMVYLYTYKKTGSTELATLASAKLHATYNRFAALYFIIAVSLSLASSWLF